MRNILVQEQAFGKGKDKREWKNDSPSISGELPLIRNKRCADDNHARYKHDAHQKGKPKPAGWAHVLAWNYG